MMRTEKQRKVFLITGTRKGIGRYLAEYYLERGQTVIGCSRQDSDLKADHYHHFALDITDESKVKELFQSVRQTHGQLDVLINNAGIASMNHSLVTPMRSVENVLRTNMMGTFLFCREAAKLMQKKKQGRIINFTTVAVPLKLAGEAVYAASKAAVITLTEVLARELGEWGITVNAIGPTPIETDLIRGVPTEKIEDLLARQAVKRMGKFQDVSNVCDFFADEKSSFITGQTLFLGGV